MNRRKLLIADDSEMNRAMLANMLDHDFQIIEAVDGHETISALEMYEGEIAALLLDIVMPEMDGFEVCQRLKADKATEGIPVIFLSVMESPGQKHRGFEVGGAGSVRVEQQLAAEALGHAGDMPVGETVPGGRVQLQQYALLGGELGIFHRNQAGMR